MTPEARLVGMSEEELYVEIGREIMGAGVFPLSPRELARQGWLWSHQVLARFVCGNEALRKVAGAESRRSDLIAAVVVILEDVSDELSPVSTLAAAALVTRVGLERLCREAWAGEETPLS